MNKKRFLPVTFIGLSVFALVACSQGEEKLQFGEQADEYARTRSVRALDAVSGAIGDYCRAQEEISLESKNCAYVYFEPAKMMKMPFFQKGFYIQDRHLRILTSDSLDSKKCVSGEQPFFLDSTEHQQVWFDQNRDGFFNNGDLTVNAICIQTPLRSDTVSVGKER